MKYDSKILDLKTSVNEKINNLSQIRFTPFTDCKFTLDGKEINIHTLTEEQCFYYIGILNASIQGFYHFVNSFIPDVTIPNENPFIDTVKDIYLKYRYMLAKKELTQLKKDIFALTNRLSEDTKTELEIEEIMKRISK
jgi:hypothetical protein